MVSVLLLTCLLASPGSVQDTPRMPSKTGDIEEMSVTSKILGRERKVWVWLPPQYKADSKRRFPVLYMNDGQNCFDGMTSYIPNAEWRADETAGALIKAGLIEPMIIAAVSNAEMERANEYLPTHVKRGTESMGGDADKYGRFLTDELAPMLSSKYRIDKNPSKTGLIGSSFGGIVTLHLGMTRPDGFGRLGVVSPSLWWDNGVMLKRTESHPSFKGQRIWVDIGTKESPTAHLQTRSLVKIFEAKGMKAGRDFAYFEEEGGGHNEPSWARRFGEILMFLYPARR